MNEPTDDQDLDLEKELKRLARENRKLQQKLKRSEGNRAQLEEYKEKNELLLRNVITDLKQAQGDLEAKNKELEASNLEMKRHVEAREKAQRERDELQSELVDIARQMGMAEIANNILHNVGNVLNSMNVSIDRLGGTLNGSKVERVGLLAELLASHENNLVEFFQNQGKTIPLFVRKLSNSLGKDHETLNLEVDTLKKGVAHIKEIISSQQTYAKTSSLTEEALISEILNDAIQMNMNQLERYAIEIDCQVVDDFKLYVDRRNIMQILMNLIANARDAMKDVPRNRGLSIRAAYGECGEGVIAIKDNGYGIPQENLTKLFTYGFTTKREGHGFGLSGCSNLVKEMGGTIEAESQGTNHGATFILRLPTMPS